MDILYVMRVASRRLQTPGVEGVPAGPITAIELDNARAAVEKLIADRAELLEALLLLKERGHTQATWETVERAIARATGEGNEPAL